MDFKEKLARLREILNILRNREDITRKFDFLLNPRNLKTATRLTASQVEFVADAHTAFKFYPEFEPLKDLANEVMLANISLQGQGRKETIDFQLASRPAQSPNTTFSIQTGDVKKKDKFKDEKEDSKK